ncbi:DUF3015 domain-containing protein [Grimontia kaedaensis]|uniref:DUF3015 domain-containing protein n=1 Tax=Grimontia kaedaensis TaxID=2872157 RepID=A0ABY4X1V6_9GAMM|nr:DUF3015 family protein [Grimontia kaedaensis]USH05185.1 DUF3015 domain-containing protein [Grimontia kaedaensis]
MKKIALFAVAAALVSGNVVAEEKKGINPWTQCGIGAMIFNDIPAAAGISNVIWDLGTTAVSSNISSQDTCEGSRVKAAMFIQDNFDQMMEDTSKGSGDYINAMLEMLEVEGESQQVVITSIRSNVGSQMAVEEVTPQSYYSAVMASL